MDIVKYTEYLEGLSEDKRKAELELNRRILCKGGRVRRLPKRVFHVSPIENREDIQRLGIVPNVESAIFTCPNIQDCITFIESTSQGKNNAMTLSMMYDIWEIDTRKTLYPKWYVNDAYDKDIIKAKSFVYFDNRFAPFMLKRVGTICLDRNGVHTDVRADRFKKVGSLNK